VPTPLQACHNCPREPPDSMLATTEIVCCLALYLAYFGRKSIRHVPLQEKAQAYEQVPSPYLERHCLPGHGRHARPRGREEARRPWSHDGPLDAAAENRPQCQ